MANDIDMKHGERFKPILPGQIFYRSLIEGSVVTTEFCIVVAIPDWIMKPLKKQLVLVDLKTGLLVRGASLITSNDESSYWLSLEGYARIDDKELIQLTHRS